MNELLGADTDFLERSSESLRTDSRRVHDIRILTQRAVAELQGSWNGSDLMPLTQQWEQQASPLLAWVAGSLEACAAQLLTQSAAQRCASSSEGGSGLAMPWPATQPPPPPDRGSPAGNARWWQSLSAPQRERVIRQHPEWIGNRDGIGFAARDLANRALITIDRGFLLAGKKRLEAALADNWSMDSVPDHFHDAVALDQVRDKLSAIAAIELTLAKPGERQLLLLDMSQPHAQSAIANGNVETADNVAVFVPGMSSDVAGTMYAYDTAMRHLQQRAQLESIRAYPTKASTTATVTWIGYQTPELGLGLFNPDTSVAFDNTAKKGAANLVPFLDGIGAARDHDAHLTLLGHSYGSTTAGLALQKETGVDDAVFFGSPGLDTNHVQNLLLTQGHDSSGAVSAGQGSAGHISYIEARGDAVGDLGAFGVDPSHLAGVVHVSARESTVVDPATGEIRHFAQVTGHTAYLADDSTSQYNMSVVVAGVPERRVYDDGEGLGDLLSMPLWMSR